jgi:hypothetical protein
MLHTISIKLLVQGHFSPIVRQARWGHKPEGVCLVVGACNRGHSASANTTGVIRPVQLLWLHAEIYWMSHSIVQRLSSSTSAAGDLIYTNSPSIVDSGSTPQAAVGSCQYFWEAFPSGSGPTDRTTYLFR